jgi:co-chaperonin GroES (HSP10)
MTATLGFTPLGDRIFVKADAPAEKVGNLFIPSAAAAKRQKEIGCTGIVRHIGPGMLMKTGSRWPMPDVRVGDRVIYLDQLWPTVKIGDEELVSLRDDGLLAVVENDV